MSAILRSIENITVEDLALTGLGWSRHQLPKNKETLRSAVVADSIRMGLYSMYYRNPQGNPIHNLELRNWIKHKLGPILPDLFDSEEENYRQVLVEGRGGNLEFLGDALLLSEGYLCPAPTRLVDVGNESYLIVSGTPSSYFQTIKNLIVHTQLGRRLDNVSRDKIKEFGFRVQSLEAYIGKPEGLTSPLEIIGHAISFAEQEWINAPDWEVYIGNIEPGTSIPNNRYGFCWESKSFSESKSYAVDVEGRLLTLWRLPFPNSRNYYSYFLSESMENAIILHPLNFTNWKQVCIALDNVGGKARHAKCLLSKDESNATLMIGFPPFEALAKVLSVFGGILSGRSRGLDIWELPIKAVSSVKYILEKTGVIFNFL